MQNVKPDPLKIHGLKPFDWNDEKSVSRVKEWVKMSEFVDPALFQLWNGDYRLNGKTVDFVDFVRGQIELGSKARWFDCPKRWDEYVSNLGKDGDLEQWRIMRSLMPQSTSPMDCHMFCSMGHMTNCHYPADCDESDCYDEEAKF